MVPFAHSPLLFCGRDKASPKSTGSSLPVYSLEHPAPPWPGNHIDVALWMRRGFFQSGASPFEPWSTKDFGDSAAVRNLELHGSSTVHAHFYIWSQVKLVPYHKPGSTLEQLIQVINHMSRYVKELLPKLFIQNLWGCGWWVVSCAVIYRYKLSSVLTTALLCPQQRYCQRSLETIRLLLRVSSDPLQFHPVRETWVSSDSKANKWVQVSSCNIAWAMGRCSVRCPLNNRTWNCHKLYSVRLFWPCMPTFCQVWAWAPALGFSFPLLWGQSKQDRRSWALPVRHEGNIKQMLYISHTLTTGQYVTERKQTVSARVLSLSVSGVCVVTWCRAVSHLTFFSNSFASVSSNPPVASQVAACSFFISASSNCNDKVHTV